MRQTEPGASASSQKADFEEIEHTADWALQIHGHDWRELLINAAHGMNSLLVAQPDAIALEREELFALEAFDAENLLVNWLSELAYWAEMERVIFQQFDFSALSPTYLEAVARGGQAIHLQKHIKAVTYHNLQIIQTDQGLSATVVFDV
jgi:SHS2 domain-containing protein